MIKTILILDNSINEINIKQIIFQMKQYIKM